MCACTQSLPANLYVSFLLSRAEFEDWKPSSADSFPSLVCSSWEQFCPTSYLHFSFSFDECMENSKRATWFPVSPIFLSSKMILTWRKPSHKCLFNNSQCLLRLWIVMFQNAQCLGVSPKWLSEIARSLCLVVLNMKAGTCLGGQSLCRRIALVGGLYPSCLFRLNVYSLPLRQLRTWEK